MLKVINVILSTQHTEGYTSQGCHPPIRYRKLPSLGTTQMYITQSVAGWCALPL